MRKEKSWTRYEYEQIYHFIRRGFTYEFLSEYRGCTKEIWKAADYSYQAKDYDVHGWSNDARRKRFHAIKYRITSSGEYLPF